AEARAQAGTQEGSGEAGGQAGGQTGAQARAQTGADQARAKEGADSQARGTGVTHHRHERGRGGWDPRLEIWAGRTVTGNEDVRLRAVLRCRRVLADGRRQPANASDWRTLRRCRQNDAAMKFPDTTRSKLGSRGPGRRTRSQEETTNVTSLTT